MNLRRETVNILYQHYNIDITGGELEVFLYNYKQVVNQENLAILTDIVNNIADSRSEFAKFIKFKQKNRYESD